MQPKEAFKLGFMSRCVEEGLSADRTNDLTKQAADWVKTAAFPNMYPTLALAAAVPPALGGLAAYLVNNATDLDDQAAVDDVKKQELVDTYQRMTDQMNRQKASRKFTKKFNRNYHL